MALSRKNIREILENEALTIDEKVTQLAKGNSDSLDALKDQIAELKRDADKLPDVQRELDELKGSSAFTEDWQGKYEQEHSDFEAYKEEQAKKSQRDAKKTAYTKLLKDAGVSEKRFASIMKLTDLDGIELNKDGGLRNIDKLTENIKSEWADFIVSEETSGAKIETPPTVEPEAGKMTKEEIMKITDRVARRKAIMENPDAFK